jgi:adenylate cyclase
MSSDGEVASVLVVDDDPINRKILTRHLEQRGHRPLAAENGLEALEMLRAEPTDVVLLDILMPEMDGIEALGRIKADPALHHIPVIMISAVEDFENVVRCIEMGAEDYLPKPFDPVLLGARIDAGLRKKRVLELERERVRGVFARFVPETVVDQVLAQADEDLRLGGVRVTGTVMFTDLRGFTTFAERKPADTVIDVLNRYLTEISDAILDNGGTLVSYMGDGVMAVFGAPIETDDHADAALASTRAILETHMPRFNEWILAQGLADQPFKIGIGLNSGPLMSGNVGSARRMEYTAVGDTTNTASRIETLTKETTYPVLVADDTRALLTEPPADLVFVDEFDIRGKERRIKLWGLDGPTP